MALSRAKEANSNWKELSPVISCLRFLLDSSNLNPAPDT
eukprot:CAMPEP_0170136694 /NCGR_PEP_ID=MMETSP0033_2-20121228/3526_1 /TAXON_ID=195969 /ORGANISM="Dolichomastix tenuilepis, Strain CCMP3274" /LENGTH=38 /DNA_ID= /DNA_START= /DNA_END= /DNA_ORIENTATION=